MEEKVCREGQLTHLFFPGRVGRGYGPDWTLVFVVSPAPTGPPPRTKNRVSHLVLIFHDLRTARIDPSRQGVMDEIRLPLWGAFPTQNMQNP